MGKALKGDSPEVEVVLTPHSQRHARTRSTISNSSFACSTAGSKVKESSSSYYSDETILWDFAYVPKVSKGHTQTRYVIIRQTQIKDTIKVSK